jgi:hypothetical protein
MAAGHAEAWIGVGLGNCRCRCVTTRGGKAAASNCGHAGTGGPSTVTPSCSSTEALAGLAALAGVLVAAGGVKWRAFNSRIDCVSASIPDTQWNLVEQSLRRQIKSRGGSEEEAQRRVDSHTASVSVELAYLIEAVATRRTSQRETRREMDVTIYDPTGKEIYNKGGQTEGQVSMSSSGSRGPWKVCFKPRSTMGLGSVVVELSYFHVDMRTMKGTKYSSTTELSEDEVKEHGGGADWGGGGPGGTENFASDQTMSQVRTQVKGLSNTIYHIYYDQKYLKNRESRHRRTAESISSRAAWSSFLLSAVITLSSAAQVIFLRRLFVPKETVAASRPTMGI